MTNHHATAASETLLLVDDDHHHLQLLQRVFMGDGYNVITASNAAETIAALERQTPDLIILDLILPDMDGYVLLETIKANPNWRLIPVIIVSSRQKLEDKLRGLRLGVMDYLTKPFEREELRARVRNLLDFYKMKMQQPAPEQRRTTHERLLDYMKERGIRALVPQVCRTAKLGYVYPEAAEILKPEVQGGEIFTLEVMAKAHLLERVFHDTIHLCPRCGHHDLNFREVCPQCEYADIEQKRVITHFGCGHRGPESEFVQDDGLRCPECFDALHRQGEDFEITPSATHVCNGCKEEFTDPVVSCRCMNCDHVFDVSATLVRRIYAYKLVAESQDSPVDPPDDQGMPGEAAQFIEHFRRHGLHYLSYDDLTPHLESLLAEKPADSPGLTLINLRFRPDRPFTHDRQNLFLEHMLMLLKEVLRPSDVVSVRSLSDWLILLPRTPYRIARILAERLNFALFRSELEGGFELSMASYPEDGQNAKELLEILKLGLVKL